jgi:hypothetical protein
VIRTTSFRLKGERRDLGRTVGPRAQKTDELIMDAARDVFLANGYHELRIDDIAEAAGESRASLSEEPVVETFGAIVGAMIAKG